MVCYKHVIAVCVIYFPCWPRIFFHLPCLLAVQSASKVKVERIKQSGYKISEHALLLSDRVSWDAFVIFSHFDVRLILACDFSFHFWRELGIWFRIVWIVIRLAITSLYIYIYGYDTITYIRPFTDVFPLFIMIITC